MADQILVQGGDDNQPSLPIEQSIRRHLLNPELSDVCFLVGEKREKMYAHRFFLAAESEVFKAMFYGELKESSYEIAVPDLSPVGFRNMLKYFYTKKVEIDLSEMHPTYMAANKYLALDLIKDLTQHIIKNRLDVSNVCVIYDQLLKLGISESLLSEVKNRIVARFSEACASDSFKQISEDTLVAILNFNMLDITELELLKACLRWTDCQVARECLGADSVSRRTKFQRIKHLIRFSAFSLGDFGSIFGLENYMTMEEIASIFLFVSQKSSPIQIDYQSPRGPPVAHVTTEIKSESTYSDLPRELKVLVSINKRVCLSSITTWPIANCGSLNLKILENGVLLNFVSKIVAYQARGDFKNWTISFGKSLVLEPNAIYTLRFSFQFIHISGNLFGKSKDMNLKSAKDGIVFKIEPENSGLNYHCIERIDFWPY